MNIGKIGFADNEKLHLKTAKIPVKTILNLLIFFLLLYSDNISWKKFHCFALKCTFVLSKILEYQTKKKKFWCDNSRI